MNWTATSDFRVKTSKVSMTPSNQPYFSTKKSGDAVFKL